MKAENWWIYWIVGSVVQALALSWFINRRREIREAEEERQRMLNRLYRSMTVDYYDEALGRWVTRDGGGKWRALEAPHR